MAKRKEKLNQCMVSYVCHEETGVGKRIKEGLSCILHDSLHLARNRICAKIKSLGSTDTLVCSCIGPTLG